MQTAYKIRSTVTGMYSRGGDEPLFNKTGKIWKRRGDLSCHLSQLMPRGKAIYARNQVEIIELELVEVVTGATSYEDWIAQVEQRAEDKKKAADSARDARLAALRFAEYQRLQREFGNK